MKGVCLARIRPTESLGHWGCEASCYYLHLPEPLRDHCTMMLWPYSGTTLGTELSEPPQPRLP